MAKYYKFTYSAGYIGTDVAEVIEIPDDYSEADVKELYEDWFECQLTASGNYKEISEEEAKENGIDESYCD